MRERNICPICLAFQDPDTGRCLVCGKRYNCISDDPLILDGKTSQGPLDYCFPVILNEKLSYVAFRGIPHFDITYDCGDKTAVFSVDICKNNDGNLLCFSL